MAYEPALDGLPRLLPSSSSSPLSLKAREHSSLSLKRIFDQINSAASDRPCVPALNASDRSTDGGKSYLAQDFPTPTRSRPFTDLAAADMDLRLATGSRQETRNFFSDRSSLLSGAVETTKFETSRFGYDREVKSPPSLQNVRCIPLEPAKVSRIDPSQREQEPTIDPFNKRAVFNLQASSMPESNQRAVRSPSPTLSFQTQQSGASDQSLGGWLFRHTQENMQATTTSHARHKSSSASSSATCRQPTAQLTIFYSGMVHVYDDVPADKAHAIMLLAGNDNSSNSHFVNAPSIGAPSSGAAMSSSATKELGVHLINTGFSNATVSSSSSFLANIKQTLAQRSDAELPFARKASLARFLEKRKDRVQAKAVVTTVKDAVEKDEMVSEQPASPKRLCSRPECPSPTPTKNSSTGH